MRLNTLLSSHLHNYSLLASKRTHFFWNCKCEINSPLFRSNGCHFDTSSSFCGGVNDAGRSCWFRCWGVKQKVIRWLLAPHCTPLKKWCVQLWTLKWLSVCLCNLGSIEKGLNRNPDPASFQISRLNSVFNISADLQNLTRSSIQSIMRSRWCSFRMHQQQRTWIAWLGLIRTPFTVSNLLCSLFVPSLGSWRDLWFSNGEMGLQTTFATVQGSIWLYCFMSWMNLSWCTHPTANSSPDCNIQDKLLGCIQDEFEKQDHGFHSLSCLTSFCCVD